MSNSGHRGSRRGPIDTDDRIMQGMARITVWARANRRKATMGLLAVLAAGAIGFIYLNYRADLEERAAITLDELRLVSRSATPAELRARLATYVEQFGSTPHGDEARLLLAEMELERDSVEAAIRLLEPVVDLAGDPIGYNAGWMMAVAEEQRGSLAGAARWYERLAGAARHEYQRRRARAARARLHVYAGEYAAAEAIYAELAESEDAAGDAEFFRVRLGEVRARAAADVPPPSVPGAAPSPGETAGPAAEPVEPGADGPETVPAGAGPEESSADTTGVNGA